MPRAAMEIVDDSNDTGTLLSRGTRPVKCTRPTKFLIVLVVLAGIGVGIWQAVVQLRPSDDEDDAGAAAAAGLALPLVKPPVEAAVPVALGGTAAVAAATATRVRPLALDVAAIHERFFSGEGPTDVFTILDWVDGRISGINTRFAQFAECLASQLPESYTLRTWGTNTTFYASCAEQWDGPNGTTGGFIQFAVVNATLYVYDRGPETALATRVTLANATNYTATQVEVWFSVGLSNLNGSHGVVHLLALPNAAPPVFEMVVAGNGIGYCSAQLRSANGTLNVTGSADAPDSACAAVDTVCTAANDTAVAAADCGAASVFELDALGREAYVGPGNVSLAASEYPASGGYAVRLAANGTDDTLFGPDAPVTTLVTPQRH